MMKKSYTLIELIIVVGMLSLILEAIVGVYLNAIRTQRKILATLDALNQVNYFLEYTERKIKMAKKDDIEIGGKTANCCPQDKINFCQANQSQISFRNAKSECERIFLSNGIIYEEIKGSFLLPLTSTSSLEIKNLNFKIEGASQEDDKQPRVTIFLEAKVKGGKSLKFQTTISQRDLDVRE